MLNSKKREIAIRAARSYIRSMGGTVSDYDALDALGAVDDLAILDKDTIAAAWYLSASQRQIRLFRKEWGIMTGCG